MGESRVSGDALEREIHEAWQRADDEGLSGGLEPFSGPTGGSPSGGGTSRGSGGRPTVSESTPVDPMRRGSTSQPSSPTRSNGGSSDSPQARVEGAEEGASVAVLEPPRVKQEVDLTEDDLLNFEKMKEQFERQVAEESAGRSARQPDPNGVGSSSPRGRGSSPTSPTSPSRGDVPPAQIRQDIQQIREDSKRFVSTDSSAVKVKSSPAQAPAQHELTPVRPAEVEVPTTRPVEAPEPRRVPETTPEVTPPHVRPRETPEPTRAPEIEPAIPQRAPQTSPEVGPLHRLMEEGASNTQTLNRPSSHTSVRARPKAKEQPKARANTRSRLRRAPGGGAESILQDIPYGLEWVEGERFAVLSSPLAHQYRDPTDILLRKKLIEKVQTYFGEVEVLKWTLPLY